MILMIVGMCLFGFSCYALRDYLFARVCVIGNLFVSLLLMIVLSLCVVCFGFVCVGFGFRLFCYVVLVWFGVGFGFVWV